MPSDERAALEHENWIAYLTGVVGCASGGAVTRAGGVVTILSGLLFDWFNQVLVEQHEATPASLLAGIVRARERRNAFVVRLRRGTDDRGLQHRHDSVSAPTRLWRCDDGARRDRRPRRWMHGGGAPGE